MLSVRFGLLRRFDSGAFYRRCLRYRRCFSRATIALPNGHDTILVDGKKLQVDTSSSKNTATTYGLSFSTLVLELNAFRTELVLVPFVPKVMLRISETDLFADSGPIPRTKFAFVAVVFSIPRKFIFEQGKQHIR